MTGFNRVVLMGNLTRDPALRQVPSGTAVADLGVAASESFKNGAGERVEKTCFVDVVAWGKQAETCGRFLKKGAPVLVEGRLQYDAWQQADGTKRSRLRVRADSVRFLGRPASSGAPAGEKPAVEPAPESGEGEKVPF